MMLAIAHTLIGENRHDRDFSIAIASAMKAFATICLERKIASPRMPTGLPPSPASQR